MALVSSMPDPQPCDITRLLNEWRSGRRSALDELTPILYDYLRRLAGYYLKSERRDHTLQPTALLHEAYIRLVKQPVPDCSSRSHFFAVSAHVMRQILVDHARTRLSQKRGGDYTKVTLDAAWQIPAGDHAAMLDLNDAVDKLASVDARKAKMIELRFFAGMTVQEIAETTNTSVATVGRELRFATSWLNTYLNEGGIAPV